MKNKDRDLFRLEHILECTKKIEQITNQLNSYQSFNTRWLEQDALIRNLEIIGEAANHISNELKEKYPNIEWDKIRGMRNIISHEYFGISLMDIWDTAINDISILKSQIEKIIHDLQN